MTTSNKVLTSVVVLMGISIILLIPLLIMDREASARVGASSYADFVAQGPEVLQQFLNDNVIRHEELVVDGVYGPKTAAKWDRYVADCENAKFFEDWRQK